MTVTTSELSVAESSGIGTTVKHDDSSVRGLASLLEKKYSISINNKTHKYTVTKGILHKHVYVHTFIFSSQ